MDVPELYVVKNNRPVKLHKSPDVQYGGVWYERWMDGPTAVLVKKPLEEQGIQTRDGDVVSAYGISVNEIWVDKQTRRRLVVIRLSREYDWRRIDGHNRRVPVDEWAPVYEWIEPAPGKTRTIPQAYGSTAEKFLQRFRPAVGEELDLPGREESQTPKPSFDNLDDLIPD